MGVKVGFGVFAHNEGAGLAAFLDALAGQDIWDAPGFEAHLLILSNGSSDDTVAVARAHPLIARLGTHAVVEDYAEGGKSRTWNRFVTHDAVADADLIGFLDADIAFDAGDVLRRLCARFEDAAATHAMVSEPVALMPEGAGLVGRLIKAGGGTSGDWKDAICGQLYIMRGAVVRDMRLPVGLPVEDGFVRAMVLSDNFTRPDLHEPDRIDGIDGVRHRFIPETTIGGLIRHQMRIVIGSSINSILFGRINAVPAAERPALVAGWAKDGDAVARVIAERLPDRRFGYVRWTFLTKRSRLMITGALRSGPQAGRARRKLILLPAFFGFDLIVFVLAQRAMARGKGQGFW